MIEQGQGPEPPEEEDSQDTEKKPTKKRNFLLSWLEARENEASKETSEDDTEKPRRGFSAMLRRFFERDVRMEPLEEVKDEKTEEKPDNILEWWPNIQRSEEDPPTEQEELFLPPTEIAAAVPVVENEVETQDTQLPAASELEEQVRIMHQIDSGSPNLEPVIVPTRSEVKEPKVVIDKKEQLAALTLVGLGAEYLGRKKQGRTQEKRIGNLEHKIETQDKKIERQSMDLPKRIAQSETDQTRELQPVRLQPETRQEALTTKEKSLPEEKAEIALPKEKVAEEVAKKVERYEKYQEAPTAVLQEMVKAAEANAPVERIYERRQEVRDEAGGSHSYGDPVPVASVLRSMSGAAHHSNYVAGPGMSSLNKQSADHNSQMYKQAAQRGFWSAIVIVIFALMVYLFM